MPVFPGRDSTDGQNRRKAAASTMSKKLGTAEAKTICRTSIDTGPEEL